MRRRWFAVVLALAGCQRVEAFVCAGDGECVDGSRAGTCEASGFCSFPDDGCASNQRYGEWAGDGLAGACVDKPAPMTCEPACGACEACVDGACQPVDGCEVPCEPACGPCQACVGGTCEANPGDSCDLECGGFVYGVVDGNSPTSCLAYASGVGVGVCDGAGACAWTASSCLDPGPELVGCDLECARADHNCTPGAPAATVTAATMCATGIETAACASVCSDNPGKLSTIVPRACDAGGRCVAEAEAECGLYACAGPNACLTSCSKMTDCSKGNCDMMTGMCV